MRGELKKKAAAILCAHYGLAGNTKAETKDLVEWLLEKGRFKYGGLNTKVGRLLYFPDYHNYIQFQLHTDPHF
jgi:hypothetical protein